MFEFIKECGQIVGYFSPLLIFVGGWWIKWKDEKQKEELKKRDDANDIKAEIRNKLILDKISEMELTVREVEASFKAHVNEDLFRKDYRKTIKFVSSSTIKNPLLHQDYKHLLTVWGELLEKFGLNYYYSKERGMKERERRKYLDEKRRLVLDEFNETIIQVIPGQRFYKKSAIRFNEFIEKLGVYAAFDVLIIDLIRNGLSDKTFNEKFEECMDKFCDNFITHTVVWDSLEKFKYNLGSDAA